MKTEIIRIKLIDRSRFIDSKNGYRITFKDSTHYRGYTIEKQSNGSYKASKNNKDFMYSGNIDEIKTDIDEEIKILNTPTYFITTIRQWEKKGKEVKPERQTKDLEQARQIRSSLASSDEYTNFVIINNHTWKEVS